jgi:probable HAF family extracellular repeat protein
MKKRELTNLRHEFAAIWTVLAFALWLSGPAAAQTFHHQRVKIKGSVSTYVTGINDSGVMVANYTDTAGTIHCVTIDGSTITDLADPNESGTGAGKGTTCWAINNAGQVVGTYTIPGQNIGFLYSGGTYTDILPPNAGYTVAYGLNNNGDIVGTFQDTVGQHGFLYNGSSYQTLDAPGASFTLAIGINDGGEMSLEWGVTGGPYQSAILRGTKYTTLNVPGDIQSEAGAINVHGEIVYAGQDASGAWHGYLYKHGTFTQFDIAGANLIRPRGINSAGEMVGWYNPGTSTLPLGFKGRFN